MGEAHRTLESIEGSSKDEMEKLEQARSVIQAIEAGIDEEYKAIQELMDGLGKLDEDSEVALKHCGEMRKKVDSAMKALGDYNRQFSEHDKAIRELRNDIEELRRKVRQRGAKSETLLKEAEDAANSAKECVMKVNFCSTCAGIISQWFTVKIEKLERQHPWIVEEKRTFNARNGPYNFDTYSYDFGKKELDRLGERRKELESTLNINAMKMMEIAEEKVSFIIRVSIEFCLSCLFPFSVPS